MSLARQQTRCNSDSAPAGAPKGIGPVTVPYTLFMDGFSSREGIIVLAATHQPDVLDKAPLRPSRFDRRVMVNLPDKTGREATAEAIDAEVLKIIGVSYDEATRLLSTYREQLDALVEALLSRETLNEQEVLEVTGFPPAPPLDTGLLPVPDAGHRSTLRSGL